jgi:hypothetical protein
MKVLRWLALALFAGVTAGISAALQTEELRHFSPVPTLVASGLIAVVGVGVGMVVKGVQEGLMMALAIALVGTVTLVLALSLPNVEVVAAAPELILRSVWLGAILILLLTIIGMVVGRILSGE